MIVADLGAHRMKPIQYFCSQQEKSRVNTRRDSIQPFIEQRVWSQDSVLCVLTYGNVTSSLLEASFCYKDERAKPNAFFFLSLLLVHTETLIYPELVSKTVTKQEWLLLSA